MRALRTILVFGCFIVGCKGAQATSPPPAEALVPVRVAAVGRGPVSRPIRGAGVVRLKREMDLSFKVGGVVTNVLVEEGARVKKGQLLARVDPTEVDAALRQAKEGAIKAERDLDRVKRLHGTGALPLAELQNAETGLALARAGTDAAAFNVQRSAILAPDDGRIDRRLVESGEVVAPGRPVFHMSGQSKGAVVRLGVTDKDVLRIHEGDEARVTIDARPGAPLPGKISQVATVASASTGTFDVEVKLDSAEALLSGLTAKIEIAHTETVSAVVPIGAVAFSRNDEAAVFVVERGRPEAPAETRARKVKVKIAFLDGERAAILEGDHALDAHSEVIDAGAAMLEDGTRIKVVQ